VRKRPWIWLLALAVPLAAGCGGSSSSTDAGGDGPGDAGDAGDVPSDGEDVLTDGEDVLTDGDDVVPDGVTRPTGTAITLTAGGGTARSSNYQLTLSVGTPQPMGSAASGTHEVRLGPGAVQNR
jgi:hypothetical protein